MAIGRSALQFIPGQAPASTAGRQPMTKAELIEYRKTLHSAVSDLADTFASHLTNSQRCAEELQRVLKEHPYTPAPPAELPPPEPEPVEPVNDITPIDG